MGDSEADDVMYAAQMLGIPSNVAQKLVSQLPTKKDATQATSRSSSTAGDSKRNSQGQSKERDERRQPRSPTRDPTSRDRRTDSSRSKERSRSKSPRSRDRRTDSSRSKERSRSKSPRSRDRRTDSSRSKEHSRSKSPISRDRRTDSSRGTGRSRSKSPSSRDRRTESSRSKEHSRSKSPTSLDRRTDSFRSSGSRDIKGPVHSRSRSPPSSGRRPDALEKSRSRSPFGSRLDQRRRRSRSRSPSASDKRHDRRKSPDSERGSRSSHKIPSGRKSPGPEQGSSQQRHSSSRSPSRIMHTKAADTPHDGSPLTHCSVSDKTKQYPSNLVNKKPPQSVNSDKGQQNMSSSKTRPSESDKPAHGNSEPVKKIEPKKLDDKQAQKELEETLRRIKELEDQQRLQEQELEKMERVLLKKRKLTAEDVKKAKIQRTEGISRQDQVSHSPSSSISSIPTPPLPSQSPQLNQQQSTSHRQYPDHVSQDNTSRQSDKPKQPMQDPLWEAALEGFISQQRKQMTAAQHPSKSREPSTSQLICNTSMPTSHSTTVPSTSCPPTNIETQSISNKSGLENPQSNATKPGVPQVQELVHIEEPQAVSADRPIGYSQNMPHQKQSPPFIPKSKASNDRDRPDSTMHGHSAASSHQKSSISKYSNRASRRERQGGNRYYDRTPKPRKSTLDPGMLCSRCHGFAHYYPEHCPLYEEKEKEGHESRRTSSRNSESRHTSSRTSESRSTSTSRSRTSEEQSSHISDKTKDSEPCECLQKPCARKHHGCSRSYGNTAHCPTICAKSDEEDQFLYGDLVIVEDFDDPSSEMAQSNQSSVLSEVKGQELDHCQTIPKTNQDGLSKNTIKLNLSEKRKRTLCTKSNSTEDMHSSAKPIPTVMNREVVHSSTTIPALMEVEVPRKTSDSSSSVKDQNNLAKTLPSLMSVKVGNSSSPIPSQTNAEKSKKTSDSSSSAKDNHSSDQHTTSHGERGISEKASQNGSAKDGHISKTSHSSRSDKERQSSNHHTRLNEKKDISGKTSQNNGSAKDSHSSNQLAPSNTRKEISGKTSNNSSSVKNGHSSTQRVPSNERRSVSGKTSQSKNSHSSNQHTQSHGKKDISGKSSQTSNSVKDGHSSNQHNPSHGRKVISGKPAHSSSSARSSGGSIQPTSSLNDKKEVSRKISHSNSSTKDKDHPSQSVNPSRGKIETSGKTPHSRSQPTSSLNRKIEVSGRTPQDRSTAKDSKPVLPKVSKVSTQSLSSAKETASQKLEESKSSSQKKPRGRFRRRNLRRTIDKFPIGQFPMGEFPMGEFPIGRNVQGQSLLSSRKEEMSSISNAMIIKGRQENVSSSNTNINERKQENTPSSKAKINERKQESMPLAASYRPIKRVWIIGDATAHKAVLHACKKGNGDHLGLKRDNISLSWQVHDQAKLGTLRAHLSKMLQMPPMRPPDFLVLHLGSLDNHQMKRKAIYDCIHAARLTLEELVPDCIPIWSEIILQTDKWEQKVPCNNFRMLVNKLARDELQQLGGRFISRASYKMHTYLYRDDLAGMLSEAGLSRFLMDLKDALLYFQKPDAKDVYINTDFLDTKHAPSSNSIMTKDKPKEVKVSNAATDKKSTSVAHRAGKDAYSTSSEMNQNTGINMDNKPIWIVGDHFVSRAGEQAKVTKDSSVFSSVAWLGKEDDAYLSEIPTRLREYSKTLPSPRAVVIHAGSYDIRKNQYYINYDVFQTVFQTIQDLWSNCIILWSDIICHYSEFTKAKVTSPSLNPATKAANKHVKNNIKWWKGTMCIHHGNINFHQKWLYDTSDTEKGHLSVVGYDIFLENLELALKNIKWTDLLPQGGVAQVSSASKTLLGTSVGTNENTSNSSQTKDAQGVSKSVIPASSSATKSKSISVSTEPVSNPSMGSKSKITAGVSVATQAEIDDETMNDKGKNLVPITLCLRCGSAKHTIVDCTVDCSVPSLNADEVKLANTKETKENVKKLENFIEYPQATKRLTFEDFEDPEIKVILNQHTQGKVSAVRQQALALQTLSLHYLAYEKVMEPMYCYVCNLKYQTERQYEAHVNGQWHRDNFFHCRQLKQQKKRFDVIQHLKDMPSIFASQNDGQEVKNQPLDEKMIEKQRLATDIHMEDTKLFFFCRICSDAVQGPVQAHVDSPRHQFELSRQVRCPKCNLFFKEGHYLSQHANSLIHKLITIRHIKKNRENLKRPTPQPIQPSNAYSTTSSTGTVSENMENLKKVPPQPIEASITSTITTSSSTVSESRKKETTVSSLANQRKSGTGIPGPVKEKSAVTQDKSPNDTTVTKSSTGIQEPVKENSAVPEDKSQGDTTVTKSRQDNGSSTKVQEQVETISEVPKVDDSSAAACQDKGSGKVVDNHDDNRTLAASGDATKEKSSAQEDMEKLESVAMDFCMPVTGFFCKLCGKFYESTITNKEKHCSSSRHKTKAAIWYIKHKTPMPPEVQATKEAQAMLSKTRNMAAGYKVAAKAAGNKMAAKEGKEPQQNITAVEGERSKGICPISQSHNAVVKEKVSIAQKTEGNCSEQEKVYPIEHIDVSEHNDDVVVIQQENDDDVVEVEDENEGSENKAEDIEDASDDEEGILEDVEVEEGEIVEDDGEADSEQVNAEQTKPMQKKQSHKNDARSTSIVLKRACERLASAVASAEASISAGEMLAKNIKSKGLPGQKERTKGHVGTAYDKAKKHNEDRSNGKSLECSSSAKQSKLSEDLLESDAHKTHSKVRNKNLCHFLVVGHTLVSNLSQDLKENKRWYSKKILEDFDVEGCRIHMHGVPKSTVDLFIQFDLWRVEKVLPDVLIIQLGAYDLANPKVTPFIVANSLIDLAEGIRKDFKTKMIYICEILPRDANPEGISSFNDKARVCNEYIRQNLRKHDWCQYWSHSQSFKADHHVYKYVDGVTLTAKGNHYLFKSYRSAVKHAMDKLGFGPSGGFDDNTYQHSEIRLKIDGKVSETISTVPEKSTKVGKTHTDPHSAMTQPSRQVRKETTSVLVKDTKVRKTQAKLNPVSHLAKKQSSRKVSEMTSSAPVKDTKVGERESKVTVSQSVKAQSSRHSVHRATANSSVQRKQFDDEKKGHVQSCEKDKKLMGDERKKSQEDEAQEDKLDEDLSMDDFMVVDEIGEGEIMDWEVPASGEISEVDDDDDVLWETGQEDGDLSEIEGESYFSMDSMIESKLGDKCIVLDSVGEEDEVGGGDGMDEDCGGKQDKDEEDNDKGKEMDQSKDADEGEEGKQGMDKKDGDERIVMDRSNDTEKVDRSDQKVIVEQQDEMETDNTDSVEHRHQENTSKIGFNTAEGMSNSDMRKENDVIKHGNMPQSSGYGQEDDNCDQKLEEGNQVEEENVPNPAEVVEDSGDVMAVKQRRVDKEVNVEQDEFVGVENKVENGEDLDKESQEQDVDQSSEGADGKSDRVDEDVNLERASGKLDRVVDELVSTGEPADNSSSKEIPHDEKPESQVTSSQSESRKTDNIFESLFGGTQLFQNKLNQNKLSEESRSTETAQTSKQRKSKKPAPRKLSEVELQFNELVRQSLSEKEKRKAMRKEAKKRKAQLKMKRKKLVPLSIQLNKMTIPSNQFQKQNQGTTKKTSGNEQDDVDDESNLEEESSEWTNSEDLDTDETGASQRSKGRDKIMDARDSVSDTVVEEEIEHRLRSRKQSGKIVEASGDGVVCGEEEGEIKRRLRSSKQSDKTNNASDSISGIAEEKGDERKLRSPERNKRSSKIVDATNSISEEEEIKHRLRSRERRGKIVDASADMSHASGKVEEEAIKTRLRSGQRSKQSRESVNANDRISIIPEEKNKLQLRSSKRRSKIVDSSEEVSGIVEEEGIEHRLRSSQQNKQSGETMDANDSISSRVERDTEDKSSKDVSSDQEMADEDDVNVSNLIDNVSGSNLIDKETLAAGDKGDDDMEETIDVVDDVHSDDALCGDKTDEDKIDVSDMTSVATSEKYSNKVCDVGDVESSAMGQKTDEIDSLGEIVSSHLEKLPDQNQNLFELTTNALESNIYQKEIGLKVPLEDSILKGANDGKSGEEENDIDVGDYRHKKVSEKEYTLLKETIEKDSGSINGANNDKDGAGQSSNAGSDTNENVAIDNQEKNRVENDACAENEMDSLKDKSVGHDAGQQALEKSTQSVPDTKKNSQSLTSKAAKLIVLNIKRMKRKLAARSGTASSSSASNKKSSGFGDTGDEAAVSKKRKVANETTPNSDNPSTSPLEDTQTEGTSSITKNMERDESYRKDQETQQDLEKPDMDMLSSVDTLLEGTSLVTKNMELCESHKDIQLSSPHTDNTNTDLPPPEDSQSEGSLGSKHLEPCESHKDGQQTIQNSENTEADMSPSKDAQPERISFVTKHLNMGGSHEESSTILTSKNNQLDNTKDINDPTISNTLVDNGTNKIDISTNKVDNTSTAKDAAEFSAEEVEDKCADKIEDHSIDDEDIVTNCMDNDASIDKDHFESRTLEVVDMCADKTEDHSTGNDEAEDMITDNIGNHSATDNNVVGIDANIAKNDSEFKTEEAAEDMCADKIEDHGIGNDEGEDMITDNIGNHSATVSVEGLDANIAKNDSESKTEEAAEDMCADKIEDHNVDNDEGEDMIADNLEDRSIDNVERLGFENVDETSIAEDGAESRTEGVEDMSVDNDHSTDNAERPDGSIAEDDQRRSRTEIVEDTITDNIADHGTENAERLGSENVEETSNAKDGAESRTEDQSKTKTKVVQDIDKMGYQISDNVQETNIAKDDLLNDKVDESRTEEIEETGADKIEDQTNSSDVERHNIDNVEYTSIAKDNSVKDNVGESRTKVDDASSENIECGGTGDIERIGSGSVKDNSIDNVDKETEHIEESETMVVGDKSSDNIVTDCTDNIESLNLDKATEKIRTDNSQVASTDKVAEASTSKTVESEAQNETVSVLEYAQSQQDDSCTLVANEQSSPKDSQKQQTRTIEENNSGQSQPTTGRTYKILVAGHSTINQLENFVSAMREMGIKEGFDSDNSKVELLGDENKTVAKFIEKDLDRVKVSKPDVVVLQFGAIELAEGLTLSDIASSITWLIQRLHYDIGVRFVVLGQVLPRQKPEPTVKIVQVLNEILKRNVECMAGYAKFWIHGEIWNPGHNVYHPDGIHWNDVGLFILFKSFKDAIDHAVKCLEDGVQETR